MRREDIHMLRAATFFGLIFIASCGVTQENPAVQGLSQSKGNKAYIASYDGYIEVEFQPQNDHVIVGGDMKIPASQLIYEIEESSLGLAREKATTLLWDNGRVPYVLPPNFSFAGDFQFAISEWKKAGINWVPKSETDVDFVQFEENPALKACGTSSLGRNKGRQTLVLPTGKNAADYRCQMRYTLLHEMGHALGFMHEHQRADRDSFVKFLGSIEGQTWLQKTSGSVPDTAFDIKSVMMYGTELTVPKMVALNGSDIPLQNQLSLADIEGARRVYASVGVPAATPTPTASAPTASAPKVSAPKAPAPKAPAPMVSAPAASAPKAPAPAASAPKALAPAAPAPKALAPAAPAPSAAARQTTDVSARCLVKINTGKVLLDQSQKRAQCLTSCGSFQKTFPSRSCVWGNEKLK
ncbi:MAG: hypothetical protein EBR09_02700 [Proteobacteria bacterium]|nr:hypothetical protein [Pseudomonadota bacterium]